MLKVANPRFTWNELQVIGNAICAPVGTDGCVPEREALAIDPLSDKPDFLSFDVIDH